MSLCIPADGSKTKWVFKLRNGVKFHDGSEFTADSVVWNLDKLLKTDSPQFDQRQPEPGALGFPERLADGGDIQQRQRRGQQRAPDSPQQR